MSARKSFCGNILFQISIRLPRRTRWTQRKVSDFLLIFFFINFCFQCCLRCFKVSERYLTVWVAMIFFTLSVSMVFVCACLFGRWGCVYVCVCVCTCLRVCGCVGAYAIPITVTYIPEDDNALSSIITRVHAPVSFLSPYFPVCLSSSLLHHSVALSTPRAPPSCSGMLVRMRSIS